MWLERETEISLLISWATPTSEPINCELENKCGKIAVPGEANQLIDRNLSKEASVGKLGSEAWGQSFLLWEAILGLLSERDLHLPFKGFPK